MRTRLLSRDAFGKYKRIVKIWTPRNWNEGYFDNSGRFRVYRPDYPRSYKGGYALRAHVVWWLKKGEPHPLGTELHHKDGTKSNDHFSNLIPLSHRDHRLAHQENNVDCVCLNCGEKFVRPKWRIDNRGAKFCSQKCFHSFPKKSRKVERTCKECGQTFLVIPSRRKKLCSPKCSAVYTWRIRHAYSR